MIDLLHELRSRPTVDGALVAWRLASRSPQHARSRELMEAARAALQTAIAGKDWWTTYEMILGAPENRGIRPAAF